MERLWAMYRGVGGSSWVEDKGKERRVVTLSSEGFKPDPTLRWSQREKDKTWGELIPLFRNTNGL